MDPKTSYTPTPSPLGALLAEKVAQTKAAGLEKRAHLAGTTPSQQLLAEFDADRQTKTFAEMAITYGEDKALEAQRLNEAEHQLAATAARNRSPGELTQDSGLGLVKGAYNLVAGAARLAVEHGPGSGLEDLMAKGYLGELAQRRAEEGRALRAGVFAAGDEHLVQPLTGLQSSVSQTNRHLVAQENAADQAENERLREEAVANGRMELLADAQRFARDFGDGFANTLSNPTNLADTAVEQVPTLALGPLARAATLESAVASRASAIASRMGGEQGITQALLNEARSTLQGRAMGAMVAATEAGSAFNQVSNEIMTMPLAELAQRYPDVAEALANGADEQAVRANLATEVGRTTALITAPIAGVAGRLTSRFELDPLSAGAGGTARRAATIGGNIGGEMAEESVQGATSEIAGNYAMQRAGDTEVDLLDDAGMASGQGAAAALGFSGAMQAPATVGVGLSAGVDAAKLALRPVTNAVSAAADAARAAEQEQVRVQAEQAAETRRGTLAEVSTAVQAAAADPTVETPAATALVEPLANEPLLDPATRAQFESEAPVTSRVEALSHTIDAMREMSARPAEEQNGQQSLDMMLFALKTAGQLRQRLGEIDATSPEAEAIQRTLLMPEVTEIEEKLPAALPAEALNQMLEALQESPDFASPRSQKAAEQVAVLAEAAPDLVSSEAARAVALYQRLAPSQKAHLETVAAAAEIREQHQAEFQRIGTNPNGKTTDIVAEEIREKGMSETRPSLAQFQRRVLTAMAKNDLPSASKAMRALMHFGRHYQAKAGAFDQAMQDSINKDGIEIRLPYSMVDGDGKKVDGKAYARKGTSERLISHIFNDANTVTELYNQLATAYPQLIKVNKTAKTPLVDRLAAVGEPQYQSKPAPTTTEVTDVAIAPTPAPVVGTQPAAQPAAAAEPAAAAATVTPTRDPAEVTDEVQDPELAKILAEARAAFEAGKDAPVAQQSTRSLDEILDLEEDNYIASINPDNKRTPEKEANGLLEELNDEDTVEAALESPITGERNGITYRTNGNFVYALDGNKVVGMLTNISTGTTRAVSKEYQGRGIGVELAKQLLRANPGAIPGSFSDAGEATWRKAFRELQAERRTENTPDSAPDAQVAAFENVPGFTAAFQLRTGAQSLFARIPNALRTLSKALKSPSALKQLFLDPNIAISAEQIGSLDALINAVVPEVIRQLNANLQRSIAEGKRFDPDTGTWVAREGAKAGGWLEGFVDGTQSVGPAQFSEAVLERGRDESGQPYVRYQAQIAQAMALASLHWVIKNVNAPIKFSDEDKAALFPDGMPQRLEEAFDNMHFAVQPVRTIATDIVRMLGMQGKKDVSVTLTDGIAKSMALDVVTALHDAEVLAIRSVEGTEAIYRKNPDTGKREIAGYKPMHFIDLKGAKGANTMKTFRTQIGSRVLSALLDPESQELPTFAPVTTVPNTVSGTEQKLSSQQKEQIRKTNATKAYRNPGLLLVVDRLGDRWLQLLGKDLVDQTTLHPKHAKTIQGVNEGLDYALERVREIDMMIHEHAPETADDTALHWSHYVVSNGRVMQNGFGNQGDKQARELLSANRVTGDLSTDASPLAKAYYLALAQALGIKTELKKNAAAVAEIQARLAQPEYQAVFAEIQGLLQGADNAEAVFTQLQALLTKPGKPTTAKAIHALVTHARLLQARNQGEADQFTTYLAFELDGKTNGPINALMHFGLLGKKVLPLLRKGGLFVDEPTPRTLSDDVADGNYSDLYKDVADETETRIGQALATRTDRAANMLKAGLRLLTLAGHVELSAGEKAISITRDMAKAGMVPTTYGSGARGVANQMASDIMAGFAKHLSEVARGEAVLDESVVKSARFIMSEKWDSELRTFVKVTPPDFSRGAHAVVFTEDHFTALVDNLVGGQRISKDERVPSGASGIMREAIEDQLKPVMDTFKLVFKASRLQMARFQSAYQAAYDAKRAELIAAGTLDKFHALSRADEEQIRDSLRHLIPAYPLQMTGGAMEGEGVFAGDKDYNGKFLVTTTKDGRSTTRNYQAESLVGGMRMDLNVRQYLSPGVKAAPLLTIGGGDATMMHLLAMGDITGTLNVYDGWEVSIDTLSAKALAANNAVLQSWQHDLLGPVAASLADADPATVIKQLGAEAVGETLGLKQYERENGLQFEKRVAEALANLKLDLSQRAELIRANKKTLFTKHKIAVDQMSGGENPATRGYTTAELNRPSVAVDAGVEGPAPIAGESAALVTRLGVDYQDGLAELGHFELTALLSNFPFTDKVRKFVVERIAHLIPDDVRVFIGTPAQIQAKQEALFPGVELGEGTVPGVTYKGVAFLTVPSEETLVHELVHLATLHLVQRHFVGAKGLTPAQKDAVRELEKMLTPFLALPASNEAIRSAQLEVQLQLDQGQPALAVNEMLAWSLANSQISDQLTAVEAPSLLKKVAKTIRALMRKLLGLPNNTLVETFLDQMQGNFHRLARRPRLADTHQELVAFQRLAGPAAETHAHHLEAMYRGFGTLLSQLRVRTVEPALQAEATRLEQEALLLAADQELKALQDSGMQLSEREQHLFRMVQAALGSHLALDPAVLTEFDKLFAHASEALDESAFLQGTGDVEEQLARDRWNAVFSDARNRRDRQGRSVLLTNFVALALSHEGLRTALARIEPPKPEVRGETFDARLRDRVTRAFDWLSDRALKTGAPANQKIHLDRLAWRLGELHTQAMQQAARAERKNLVDRLEDKLKGQLQRLDSQAERVAQNQSLQGWMRQSVQWGRGLLSDTAAEANAESALSLANQPNVPQVVVDMVSELAGNTPSTTRLHRLVNLTRHAVSRVRQQLREEAPADVRAFFKTALSEATWAQLHRTVGQIDLQAVANLGVSRLAVVVSDATQRQVEIDKLVAQLGPHQALYVAEAQTLARAIARKDVAPRYRNAEALAALFGQAQVGERQVRRLAPLLDRLVSLYALEHLSDGERTGLSNLLGQDPEGMRKLLNSMRTLVSNENRKSEQRQRYNRWKGYVPQSADPRQQIVLATAKQAADLVKRGYRKVGTYRKDALDPANDLAYYAVNWIGGQSTFNQGALQTVEGTLSGVDALTGQTLDPGVGTLITNEGVVSSIAARHKGTADRLLAPVYNLDGDVVAYERLLDPAVVEAHTGGRKDLALSIGIWLGRQAEEELAESMNGQVVQALKQRWVADKAAGKGNEYVAINTSKDPVIADTWNTIPRHTQDVLKAAFGDQVMVRRDMLRNAVGYRSASIADAFTGMSTLPPPVRRAIVDAVYVLPGLDYKKIVAAEKAIQGAVGTAKDWIVVRSGVVAVANGVANMFQLTASGINPLHLPKLIARKAQETEIYLRNEKRLSRIRVELTAVKRPDERNKLLLEQQRLLDANARLSIAPLIFAGELPTIAEGLSEHDQYTLTGDMQKWIEKKAEQLPQGVLTAAKIVSISKDTALYQGLNRMVQFGDFTAKAVLYDKWIQDGMSSEEALSKISERFVNYNLNAGRTREYLESVGLLWFWNYKLRVQKVVLATIRENPLRFLLSTTGADLVGSDSLLTSAAPFVYWDYSIGPDQLFRAPEATLWHQLFR